MYCIPVNRPVRGFTLCPGVQGLTPFVQRFFLGNIRFDIAQVTTIVVLPHTTTFCAN